MTQAIERVKLLEKENVELRSELGTLNVEVKRLIHNKHINGVRLASKDDEIIKAHTVHYAKKRPLFFNLDCLPRQASK